MPFQMMGMSLIYFAQTLGLYTQSFTCCNSFSTVLSEKNSKIFCATKKLLIFATEWLLLMTHKATL